MPGFTNLFITLELRGKMWLVERGFNGDQQNVILDLGRELKIGGGSGLLGMAFHPKFPSNRKYFLNYQIETNGQIFTLLVERRFTPDFKMDSGESRVLMKIPATTDAHTGGNIAFGPDGFLYLGMGDTGPQRDPQGHAQNLSLWLGKMLRIDVDHTEKNRAYKIPRTNPFRTRRGVLPEIWACGLREPWRFSFDRATGDLWIGDVGQDRFEEVDLARAGENFGWNVFEGVTPFSDEFRRTGEKFVPPIFAYSRKYGVSITGGYVYRGKSAPDFFGKYICGDFQSRRVWAITQTNRVLAGVVEIGVAPSEIVSFAEDHAGELYVVGYGSGLIYRMEFPSSRETSERSRVNERSIILEN
jgi:glucose/arabinose dehydrogenase